ncbi:hypothetical protein ABIB57_005180 [Devosia sp. UYZn731]
MGQFRWLTLISADDGVKLLIEPAFPLPTARAQAALYDSNFPALILTSEDIEADVGRLESNRVQLLGPIADFPGGRTVFFDDGLGNVVNLTQRILRHGGTSQKLY